MALAAVSISAMCQVTFIAVEGSDWTDGEGSAKAFDGNLNTKWCKGANSDVNKAYLMLEASEATYIQGFKMTTANDNTDDPGRVPEDYTIFGSNDKAQWDIIYHQKEDHLIEDKNFTEYTVYCNSKQKYKYFKLWIKKNSSRSADFKNHLFQLSEFALLPAAFGMTLESGNAKAMDGDTGEKWEGKTPQTVVVKATSACQLIGYQFTTGNDNRLYPGRNPKDWTVEGSNDQQTWTTIDTKTDDKVMQDNNYYPYFFPVTPPETAYQYYRFTITQSVGEEYFQMSELALKTIAAHTHKWKTTQTVAATCGAEGYEMQTCSICEATRKANVVPATGAHTYVDGICTVCHQIDPSIMTLNAEGIYELSTALQLKLWGKAIENGQYAAKAKLMADIDLKGTDFNGINIPEGSPSFGGELNGNGHWIQHMTLKGARNNLAFLSRTENAKIYDLGFRDARVELSGSFNNTSVIVGTAVGTKISRCAVMESSVRGHDHVAAFVGESKATTVISDCLAKAKIVSDEHQAGGLVGTSTGLTLTHCLFRGTVDNEELHASGILGLIDATAVPTRLSHNMVAADHIFSVQKWTHPLLQTSGRGCSLKSNYTLATTLYGSPGSPYTNRYTNPNDENGQQVTEATAKSNAHYATTLGWDMEKVWAHVDNDYPILRWMKPNGGPTGINHIKTTDREGTVRYYDLQGRYIGISLNSLPAGVYIGGGKKIMKK
ncbi:discoidin domain-containing protein [Prevotella multiformis]|uniref:F5/8 type C domain protein n=1 Tax=Prevotella multiformis DSM 16608 TaxID=888743 RepID=F0FAN4_9BACT|nr:discoidin domain-containing protein [Prevotella multiformis]EGC18803.1 F5/8 type C domain protein [Prevotella multiformis DSM 16608]